MYRRIAADIAAVQLAFEQQGVAVAILPHLRRLDHENVLKECFNVLHLIYRNNSETPAAFVEHVEEMHEEAFFSR